MSVQLGIQAHSLTHHKPSKTRALPGGGRFFGLVGLQELQVQKRTSPLQEWDFDVLDQFEHSIISLGYVT